MTLQNTLLAAERATALDAMKSILGPGGWTQDASDMAPHEVDWRGTAQGKAAMVAYPRTPDILAQIVRIANAERVAMVPQGGNTGLVQGGVPTAAGDQLLVSLRKMNHIRSVDPDDYTMIAEAGCVLATVQAAARDHDRLFPMSLGSEGSCTIGGLISTNAGGVHVLRYGVMRSLVLGIEAVLPDGTIFHGLTPLRKDNTGYDLKQLLIGAEGTLGFVTAASLKLYPAPKTSVTAFIGIDNPAAALATLTRLRADTGDQVCAFEVIPRDGLALVLEHIPGTRDPLDAPYPWYALVDVTSPAADAPLAIQVESALAAAMEAGHVRDAVIAANQTQAAAFWKIRETLPDAEKIAGGSFHNDVSVPVAAVPAFLNNANNAVARAFPGCRPVPFGHLGDGNIHYSIRPPAGGDDQAFFARQKEVTALINEQVLKFGGSISAEHGIGALKIDELEQTADPAKLAMMRRIKAAIDPHGIMNPGRVVRPE